MDKFWKKEQLSKISAQTSIFKHIPEEIGNVLYCDTNQPGEVALGEKEAKRKKITSIAICAVILLLYWVFLYDHYIWGAIISIIGILVTIVASDTTFSGTDYFVGDKGFATVSFYNSRDNITSTKVIPFKEIEYFFTQETIVKTNYIYSNTQYSFSIFGKEDLNTHRYDSIFSTIGSYEYKKTKDPMNPNGANEEYCMMRMVEKAWTSYFVLSHANDAKINFGVLDKESMYSDAIAISRDELDVYGTIYNPNNTKKIYVSNGELVIEHINHSRKFFGFVEKGNISSIPLSSLGNRKAFMIFFDRLYQS